MRSLRISHALETGALRLPSEGLIAVFNAAGDDGFDGLPVERVRMVQGFRPDHDMLAARGFTVSVGAEGDYAAAVICLPRAKAEARALVAEAVAHVPVGGLVIVDGQKTDGVDSMLKECRARADVGEPVSKAHGKLFAFPSPGVAAFADWRAVPLLLAGGFETVPGVFSADGIDPGSALLAAALPAHLPKRVADLGAGWGYLSRAILAREGVEVVHLVEASAGALDCARRNVVDPRAQFHWADAVQFRLQGPVDAVVMNPPFHVGRETNAALGVAFIRAAGSYMGPNGVLWMVANRHLPYDAALAEAFRDVEEIGGDRSYRLIRASRPTKPPRK